MYIYIYIHTYTYTKYRVLPQETSLLWENVLQSIREMTNKGTFKYICDERSF